MDELVRPGLLGRAVRILFGAGVAWMGVSTVTAWEAFRAGLPLNSGTYAMLAVLVVFTSWVVNELARQHWGGAPLVGMLSVCALAAGVGAYQGDLLGPPLGMIVFVWGVGFALLLAPALLLAAVLGTPGCEMRSYADLWTRLRGGNPHRVACPGWIDRLDGVRLFGRF